MKPLASAATNVGKSVNLQFGRLNEALTQAHPAYQISNIAGQREGPNYPDVTGGSYSGGYTPGGSHA